LLVGLIWLAREMPFAFPSKIMRNIQGFAYINRESTILVKSFFSNLVFAIFFHHKDIKAQTDLL